MNETISVSDWVDAEWIEAAAADLDDEATELASAGRHDAATDKAAIAAYLRWSWEKLEC